VDSRQGIRRKRVFLCREYSNTALEGHFCGFASIEFRRESKFWASVNAGKA